MNGDALPGRGREQPVKGTEPLSKLTIMGNL